MVAFTRYPPYGETKAISEQILIDIAGVNPDWSVALLRYFNPVGAHESGLIGRAPSVTDLPDTQKGCFNKNKKGRVWYGE